MIVRVTGQQADTLLCCVRAPGPPVIIVAVAWVTNCKGAQAHFGPALTACRRTSFIARSMFVLSFADVANLATSDADAAIGTRC